VTGDEARALALSFPEAEERETSGDPTFRVRDKIVMTMDREGTAATVKAPREAQAALVGSDPDTFSIPAYVGQRGWVGVALDRVDPEEFAELVDEAWRMTAPKRLVKVYDAQ